MELAAEDGAECDEAEEAEIVDAERSRHSLLAAQGGVGGLESID